METKNTFLVTTFHNIPIYRIPLLFLNSITVVLAFSGCRTFSFNSFPETIPALTLAIVTVVEIFFNTGVVLRHFGGESHDENSKQELMFTLIRAVFDTVFGIMFLILHAMLTVNSTAGYNWNRPGTQIVVMYAAFGALFACLCHSFFAALEICFYVKAKRPKQPLCANCRRAIQGAAGRGAREPTETVANDAEDEENAHLISTAEDD